MADRTFRLAVASREGAAISEHFGHAREFWIYEVSAERCSLLERREVEHYCHGNSSSKTAMPGILAAVSDCQAVFVARIGEGPTGKLAAIGVEAVSHYAYEAIEASLLDYVRTRPD